MHAWVADEMQKQFRSQLHLPVAETLHIAHVLAETVEGFLTGANRSIDKHHCPGSVTKGWRSHVLAAKDGSGKTTVINYFGRLEQ